MSTILSNPLTIPFTLLLLAVVGLVLADKSHRTKEFSLVEELARQEQQRVELVVSYEAEKLKLNRLKAEWQEQAQQTMWDLAQREQRINGMIALFPNLAYIASKTNLIESEPGTVTRRLKPLSVEELAELFGDELSGSTAELRQN